MEMELNFNSQVDYDSIDVTEWNSSNSLFDMVGKEYLPFQDIVVEEETEGSTFDKFDGYTENSMTNSNENVKAKMSPKIFEIIKDMTKRRNK